jgi:hypothetical protein
MRPHLSDPGSTLMTVTASVHAQRRVAWDRALSASALRTYMPLLTVRISELCDRLSEFSGTGQIVDMAKWFGLFAVDFMGDFAWGGTGEFNFMRSSAGRPAGDGENADSAMTKAMHDGLTAYGVLALIPWIRPILHALPVDGVAITLEKSRTVLKRRRARENKTGERDLFYHLVSELPTLARRRPSDAQLCS